MTECSESEEKIILPSSNETYLPLYMEHFPVRDTIFLLGDRYVELSIKKQRASVIFRDKKDTLSFKISSGTSRINKGIDTPPGLYTVQVKSPLAISKQFDNAELYHWVGFNGNMGFHGLKGDSYYRSLGIRPSSHGCVRISREDGEKLYNNVKLGTPVYVVDNEPARIIIFANDNEFYAGTDYMITERNALQYRQLTKRIKNLYSGKAYSRNFGRYFLDGKTVIRGGGYELGDASSIRQPQEIPVLIFQRDYFQKDVIKKRPDVFIYDSASFKPKSNDLIEHILRNTF
ncbi:MAG: L,D-transpeptidase [FCB group bacterium]|jgi:hypothetical protein